MLRRTQLTFELSAGRARRISRRRASVCGFAALIWLAALAPVGLFSNGALSAGGFLSILEDIPLAPGLVEAQGEAVMFDSPAGRIAEATAEGRSAERAQVLRFYRDTLPQLGWQADGEATFRREGEYLSIETTKPAGPLTVRFRLRPAEAPRP